jgi:transposase
MGRGKKLTTHEQGQIVAYNNTGMPPKEIATKLQRSQTCIENFLKNPTHYEKKNPGGRPQILDDRDKRRIYRMAYQGVWSANDIKTELQLNASVSTVTRALNSNEIFKYVKPNIGPQLTQQHRDKRVKWVTEFVDFGAKNWYRTIFSDEKKWNLDGPDGLKCYWYDTRKEKKQFFSRQNGGGSVMVWGGFWANGTTDICFTTGSQCARDYVYTLSEYLLPSAHLHFGTDFYFQQDNAAIHTASETTEFFKEQLIQKIDWSSKSPDLNPIENVWGYLTRRVYAAGKQYHNTDDLKKAIEHEWKALPRDYLKKLVDSMKTRCLKVYKADGKTIDY